jgi:hypothetical protein
MIAVLALNLTYCVSKSLRGLFGLKQRKETVLLINSYLCGLRNTSPK